MTRIITLITSKIISVKTVIIAQVALHPQQLFYCPDTK